MKTCKRIIEFLNEMKDFNIWGVKREHLSDQDKEYLDRIPTQNPYGIIGLILGGIAFTFGPQYGLIPVTTLIFCVVTFFTFDKEKEDNPWPFYFGIGLSLIGLSMYISGTTHQLLF